MRIIKNKFRRVMEFLAMAKNTQTTETKQDEVDNFWGQPHFEGETFSVREFENSFLNVYMYEPFLGGISREVTKFPDPKCSTAYVGIRHESQELIMGYNPYFFRSLTPLQRTGVIIHEIYHLVLQHLFERSVADKNYAMAWNIGTDLAINSIIGATRLPDMALIPGHTPSMMTQPKIVNFIKTAKPLLASEFYFESIKQILDEMEKNGEGGLEGVGTLDDHSGWGDIPENLRDQIKDKVKGLIQRAVNRADGSNNWGTVPESMKNEIRKGLSSEINWRAVIKMFFGTARSMERISTIKKISRKLPGIIPGVKRGVTARFAMFIDQSGSMSDEAVTMMFSEVEAASRETQLDVFNFDTEIDVNSHKVWKRGRTFQWERTRCGGTDFNAVAEFVNRPENYGKWSGICIFTDGYAPTMGYVRGAKVLWIITPDGQPGISRPGDLVVQLRKDQKLPRM